MNQIPARYWLGLTATPFRCDRLDELMYHQLGQVAHTLTGPVPDQLPETTDQLPAPLPRLTIHPTAFTYKATPTSASRAESPKSTRT